MCVISALIMILRDKEIGMDTVVSFLNVKNGYWPVLSNCSFISRLTYKNHGYLLGSIGTYLLPWQRVDNRLH